MRVKIREGECKVEMWSNCSLYWVLHTWIKCSKFSLYFLILLELLVNLFLTSLHVHKYSKFLRLSCDRYPCRSGIILLKTIYNIFDKYVSHFEIYANLLTKQLVSPKRNNAQIFNKKITKTSPICCVCSRASTKPASEAVSHMTAAHQLIHYGKATHGRALYTILLERSKTKAQFLLHQTTLRSGIWVLPEHLFRSENVDTFDIFEMKRLF